MQLVLKRVISAAVTSDTSTQTLYSFRNNPVYPIKNTVHGMFYG